MEHLIKEMCNKLELSKEGEMLIRNNYGQDPKRILHALCDYLELKEKNDPVLRAKRLLNNYKSDSFFV